MNRKQFESVLCLPPQKAFGLSYRVFCSLPRPINTGTMGAVQTSLCICSLKDPCTLTFAVGNYPPF